MPQVVPLYAVPNQTFYVPLDGQNCRLNIYQKTTGLFMDVLVDEAAIIVGVICQDRNRIVRDLYLGFRGDFAFYDLQGGDSPIDPVYTGLGDRFQLVYILPSELPAGVG